MAPSPGLSNRVQTTQADADKRQVLATTSAASKRHGQQVGQHEYCGAGVEVRKAELLK
jgi:hypothetical protein